MLGETESKRVREREGERRASNILPPGDQNTLPHQTALLKEEVLKKDLELVVSPERYLSMCCLSWCLCLS